MGSSAESRAGAQTSFRGAKRALAGGYEGGDSPMAGPVTTRRVSVAAMLAVLTVAAFMLITRGFSADATSSLPADKMTTSAASWSVQGPNTTVPVLTAQMRTSNPADLILHLTSECSILSSITNMGTSDTQMFQSTVQF